MKKVYSTILFLLVICVCSVAQTRTIKIAKPAAPPKKDTVLPKKVKPYLWDFRAGSNYTFKGIDKVGYEAQVIFVRGAYIGINYSHEIESYRVSAYNTEAQALQTPYSNSASSSDYIKIPFGVSTHMAIGNAKLSPPVFYLTLGLAPSYLLKTKNESGLLNDSNFNKFNLEGNVQIGFPIRKHYAINIGYTKDFFDNLKDKLLYNELGEAIGKQKSKTNLLTLSVSYRFGEG